MRLENAKKRKSPGGSKLGVVGDGGCMGDVNQE